MISARSWMVPPHSLVIADDVFPDIQWVLVISGAYIGFVDASNADTIRFIKS